MNDNIQRLFGKNVFLLYRGTNEIKDSVTLYTNSKYVGARIFYELSQYDDCNIFFAPGCYAENDNYQEHLPEIFLSVNVAVIIMSNGMLDRCFKDGDTNYDDTLYKELRIVFEKHVKEEIKIILVDTGDGYSLDMDKEKTRLLFCDIWAKKRVEDGNYNPLSQVSKVYADNKAEFFADLYGDIHGELLRIKYNKLLKYGNHKTDVESSVIIEELLKCSSTTMIRDKIIEKILRILEDSQADEDIRLHAKFVDESGHISISKLRESVKIWIEVIGREIKHFSALEQLYKEKIATSDYGLISIEQALEKDNKDELYAMINSIRAALGKRKKQFNDYGSRYILANDSILTYSHSEYVTSFLKGRNSGKCDVLYICETHSKSLELFNDAHNIFCDNANFARNRVFITDSSVYQLISEGKITKVILGACSVTIKNGILTEVINTAGSETIVYAAKKFGIPVYIISNTKKHIEEFISRDQYLLTNEIIKKYPDKKICVQSGGTFGFERDEVSYVKIDRTDNMLFISENGLDFECVIQYFITDIWKDDRKLRLNSDNLIKGCTFEAYSKEKMLLSYLKEKQINVPEIVSVNDENAEIEMKRINGIRIFELFVALDELTAEGVESAYRLKERILNKCYEQQKNIWRALNRDNNELSPYPIEKISCMMISLLKCANAFYPNIELFVNAESLEEECKRYYSEFCGYELVPFRDSTIKNMIIDVDELSGLDHIDISENLIKLKNALYDILKQKGVTCFDNNKIYDVDFSSCVNTTNRYDDFIGLKMHERTYSKRTEKEVLSGIAKGMRINNREFFMGLFMRYIRFGGRKLLYRLINPKFQKVRFKFDDERFYFKKLVFYINKLAPEFKKDYPGMIELVAFFADAELVSPSINFFDEYRKSLSTETMDDMCPWLGIWEVY